MVLLGALINRYLIVVPNLLHPFVPIQHAQHGYATYNPTLIEWTITARKRVEVSKFVTSFSRCLCDQRVLGSLEFRCKVFFVSNLGTKFLFNFRVDRVFFYLYFFHYSKIFYLSKTTKTQPL